MKKILSSTYIIIIILSLHVSNSHATEYQNVKIGSDLKLLLKQIKVNWSFHPDSSLQIGHRAISNDLRLYNISEQVSLYYYHAVSFKHIGNLDSAQLYFTKSANLSQKSHLHHLFYKSLGQIGALYSSQERYDTARYLMKQSVDFYIKKNDNYELKVLYINIGNSYFNQNRNNYALEHYLKALKLKALKDDDDTYAHINMSIGAVYNNLGHLFCTFDSIKSRGYFQQSLYYLDTALKYFRISNNQLGICYSLTNYTFALQSIGKYPLADSLLKLQANCLIENDAYLMTEGLLQLAKSEENKRNDQNAINILRKLNSNNALQNTTYYHKAKLYYAKLLHRRNKMDSAIIISENSTNWLIKNQHQAYAYSGALKTSHWYEEQKNEHKALEWSRIESVCKDSLITNINREIFDDLQIQYQTNLLKKQLELITEKSNLQKQQKITIIIIATLLFILLFIGILVLYLRRKKALVLLELSNEKSQKLEGEIKLKESESKNLRLETELYKAGEKKKDLEVQIKNKELLFQSMKQIEINNVIKETLQKLKPYGISISRKQKREEYYGIIQELSRDYKTDHMSHFETIFQHTYGDFNQKLLDINPSITRSEFYVAALLRLNLSSKEISQILNLATGTVDKTRYQLRQKFQLRTGENLNNFIIHL